MKKKKGFELRHLLRENVIISKGKENIDFNKIIVLNESAAYLWEAVGEEEEFTAASLAARFGGDPRVHCVRNEHNSFQAVSRNHGAREAKGDYLLFLNAGDRLHRANVLEQLSRAIERSATTHGVMPPVVYGETELIDAQGHDLGPRRLHTPDTLTWRSFRRGMVVCHQSFLVLRTYALRHPYNLSYRYSADQDWCIRIMKQAQQDLPDTPAKHVLLNSRTLISDYLNEGTTTRHHRDSLRERFVIYRHHYGLLTTLLCHAWFLLRAAFK